MSAISPAGCAEQLLRRLDALRVATGFVFLYRQQHGARRLAIGSVPPNPVDDSHYAFVL